MDDLTLGEMLTQAYRGQVDYFVQGGMSVSQSSSSVMFDGSGQPDPEERDFGQRGGLATNAIRREERILRKRICRGGREHSECHVASWAFSI